MSKNDNERNELIGKLISLEIDGTDYVGIVVDETNKQYITLQKCDLWERYKLYFVHTDVTIRIYTTSEPVIFIYENFKEMNE